MDSKVPLLSSFNYDDWKHTMSEYLKRQCLFDLSIGALSEPESYEEKIDWIIIVIEIMELYVWECLQI